MEDCVDIQLRDDGDLNQEKGGNNDDGEKQVDLGCIVEVPRTVSLFGNIHFLLCH